MLDVTKPVKYVDDDGKTYPARIICTDRKGQEQSIVALIYKEDGIERVGFFTTEGQASSPTSVRLVNVRTMYVNIYDKPSRTDAYKTRELADMHAAPDRIKCIEVEY